MLKVSVYDPRGEGDMQKIGHHGLITVYSGGVNWEQVLFGEMEDRAGKILVTGNLSPELSTGIVG